MKILFIAFEFPPLNRGGVYRSLAFANYLPQFGIDPVVITLAEGSYQNVYSEYSSDESLKKRIKENIPIIEVEAGRSEKGGRIRRFTSIYFSIHGNEVNQWKNNFYTAVEKAVIKYQPVAIFATVPPFSVLPLAKNIAELYQLPLIIDFRDAWSQWRSIPYGSVFHYFRTLALEKKYLTAASAVITTSQQTLDDFKRLHPGTDKNKFHCILNGYEGELLKWQPLDADKDYFTIGYVGSFYFSPGARQQMLRPWWRKRGHRVLQYIPHKQDWLYRSPYFFFKALKQLNIVHPEYEKKIKVKFAGKIPVWLPDMINEFKLNNTVELLGELTHHDSILFQQQCDALLITSAKQLDGKPDYSIAGKTYEYFQAQRPVIAFVCRGAQKDILEAAGTAVICDPDNTDVAADILNDFFKGKKKMEPDYGFIQSLSRAKLTEKLAQLIKDTVTQND